MQQLFWISILSLTIYSGCAALETIQFENTGSHDIEVDDIKEKMQSYDSLHFTIYGYNITRLNQVADFAESIYKKVMFDANLLSFKPKQNYQITIFNSKDDFLKVTGYPSWSGGGAITVPSGMILPSERENVARTSIVTFEEMAVSATLAHEVTHLVFNEYMNFSTPEEANKNRWLNEGFATYEEYETYEYSEKEYYLNTTRDLYKKHLLPLAELISFNPFTSPSRILESYTFKNRVYVYTTLDLWYWQSRSVVSYIITEKGKYNFFLFISALKRGNALDSALEQAFPGTWRTINDLERDWLQTMR